MLLLLFCCFCVARCRRAAEQQALAEEKARMLEAEGAPYAAAPAGAYGYAAAAPSGTRCESYYCYSTSSTSAGEKQLSAAEVAEAEKRSAAAAIKAAGEPGDERSQGGEAFESFSTLLQMQLDSMTR